MLKFVISDPPHSPSPPPPHPVPGEAGCSTCQERVERIWASRVSLRSYLTEGGKGRVSSTDNGPEKARKTRNSQAGAGQSHLSHKALVPALEAPGRWGGHRSTALVPLTSEPDCAPFFPACADPACHSWSCSRLTPSLGPFPINPAHGWSLPPPNTSRAWVTLFSIELLFNLPAGEDNYSEVSPVGSMKQPWSRSQHSTWCLNSAQWMLAILLLLLFFLPPHIDIIVIARGRMVDSILENSTLLQTQVRGVRNYVNPFSPLRKTSWRTKWMSMTLLLW